MKVLKCPSCSAPVNQNSEETVCSYCNSLLFREDINLGEQSLPNETDKFRQQEDKLHVPSRPKLHIGSMIWLCILYIFPGIIYYNSVKKKQQQWDSLYSQYNTNRPNYPELDMGLMVFLCILYIFPGVIYYNAIKKKQALWNAQYLTTDI